MQLPGRQERRGLFQRSRIQRRDLNKVNGIQKRSPSVTVEHAGPSVITNLAAILPRDDDKNEKDEKEDKEDEKEESDDEESDADDDDDDVITKVLKTTMTTESATTATLQRKPAATPDDDDDDDGPSSSANPPQVKTTAGSLPTGQPPHSIGSSNDDSGALSEGTEHLLIAFGSIAATLVLLVALFVIYRLRRGVPKDQLFKLHPDRRNRPYNPRMADEGSVYPQSSLPTAVAPTVTESFNDKIDDYYMRSDHNPSGQAQPEWVAPPPRALVSRNNTNGSSKTLGDTLSSQQKNRAASPQGKSDLPLRNASPDASTPILPPLDLSRQESTKSSNRPKSSYDFGDGLTPLPHQSFMIGPRYGPEAAKDSRFSWSTYAPQTPAPQTSAPQTPASAYDDNNRISVASSVPRFRTVDSWVQNQQTRIDVEREEENQRVPEVPKKFKTPGQNGVGTTAPPLAHARNISDASVFRKHPGNQVSYV